MDLIFSNPQQVDDEAAMAIVSLLACDGIAHMTIIERDGKHRRVVMAPLPATEEVMVAMEGSGCIFLDRTSHTNHFVFITAGFQLTAAMILSRVMERLVALRAEFNQHRQLPQLTHQNRS